MALLPQKKSEQIKLYVLLIGCVAFVAVGYFRFIHKKSPSSARRAPVLASLDRLQVPRIDLGPAPDMQTPAMTAAKAPGTILRDIFSPTALSSVAKNSSPTQPPGERSSVLTLMGTLTGGGKPMAVINDQFVGTGDWIGEYQVVRIDKNKVLLDSGNRQIKLEMVKDEY